MALSSDRAEVSETGWSPEPLPPLRALQRALDEQGTGEPSLLVVTDALVDSVGSLSALLGRAFESPGSVYLRRIDRLSSRPRPGLRRETRWPADLFHRWMAL